MKLYLLQYGHGASGAPMPGYLIQTDDGVNVLVDTGLPVGHDAAIAAFLGAPRGEEELVVNRLASIGLAPRDIRYLICTHFDIDHAGCHDAFPDAELVVQRSHYAVAREDPRFDTLLSIPVRAHWDHPDLHYRLIEGDTELLPGIELIETSGHAIGHQSVLVRLPNTGPVLLAIDAIKHADQLDPATRSFNAFDTDEAALRASTRKLVELAGREGVTLLVFGHDAQQWSTLKQAPKYYD